MNGVDGVRVRNIINERAVPFAEKFTEHVAFTNALFAQNNRRSLIITTGVKDTSNSGGQNVQSNLVNVRSVVSTKKSDEKFFSSGRSVPSGQGMEKIFNYVEPVSVTVCSHSL